MRTFFYVDGLNLYKRCLEGTPHKWLDLAALVAAELPGNEAVRIRYFTARVSSAIGRPGAEMRQQAYLSALGTLPGLTRHYGEIRTDATFMRSLWPAVTGEHVEVWNTREKGSDVNLAAQVFFDLATHSDDYDALVLVTHDSDQAVTLRLARELTDKAIGVLDPSPVRSKQLFRQADFYRNIHPKSLRDSQFPDEVVLRSGARVRRPAGW